MDLSAIKATTSKLRIMHPASGEETGLILEVGSLECEAVKKVDRRIRDRMLKSRGKKVSAEQLDEASAERIAATVVGWEWTGAASFGGKKLEFNPENVATVLAINWIRSQVEEAVQDEAAFFTA